MFGGGGANTGFSFGQQPAQQQQAQQPFGSQFSGFGGGQQQQPQQQSAFGGGQATGGFGAPASTGAFGQNNVLGGNQQQSAFGQQKPVGTLGGFGATPAFGQQNQQQNNNNMPTSLSANNGTGNPSWSVTVEREQATISVLSNYQAISAMPAYKNWSIEELRVQDYVMGKKFAGQGASSLTTTSTFGQPQPQASSFGGFGATPAPAATTSMFGAPAPSTGFGAPSTGFGQPAQPQQSTLGGFGSAFGANTAAPKPFGAPATTAAPSAFGAPTATGGFGTGGFGSAFGQTQQQPAAAPSMFGQPQQQQPATSMFGQPAAQKPGLFGAAPAATTTGFGFGQQQQQQQPQQAAPAFGGFGAQPKPAVPAFGQQAAPATGGLFGKPAAQPGVAPSLFGTAPATTTTSTFGFGAQPAQQSTGLFGAQPAAPATTGLFGGGGAQTGTGLFGNTAPTQPASTGLFGAKPAATSAFGSMPAPAATTTAFTFGGAQQPQQQQQQQQPTTSLFGNSFGTAAPQQNTLGMSGGGSLFGTSFGVGQQQNQQQLQQPQHQGPVLHASLNKNPYGINPLLQKSPSTNPPVPATDKGPVNSTPALEKKLPTLTPTFKVTPRSASQIKLRGIAPAASGPALAESHRNQIGEGLGSTKKSLHVLDGSPRDVVALGLDARFTPRRSVKRLDIDDASIFLSGTPAKPAISFKSDSGAGKVTVDPTLEDAAASIIAASSLAPGGEVSRSASPSPPRSTFRSVSPGSAAANAAKSYIMTPSIDALLRLSDAELSALPNFSISVPLFGSVTFLEPVDLLAASPTNTRAGIQDIPGNVVVISSQLVTVYPDDSIKHPMGQGLNVPAVITLASCFPKDRKTGDIIDNAADPRFDKHLKKLRQMPDTTFIGFEVVSGTWKFRVEHFSKYGLLDSDDESGDEGAVVPETPGAGLVEKKGRVQFQDQNDDDGEDDGLDDTFIIQSGGKKWPSTLGTYNKTPMKAFKQSPLSRQVVEDSADEESGMDEYDEEEEWIIEDGEMIVESGDEYEEGTESNVSYVEEGEEGEEMEEDEYSSENDGVYEQDDEAINQPAQNTINANMATVDRMQLARNVQTMKASLFPVSSGGDSSTPTFGKKIVLPSKPVSFSFSAIKETTSSAKREVSHDESDDATVPGVVSRSEFASLPIVSTGSPQKYSRQERLLVSKVDLSRAVPYEKSITYGKHKSGALDTAFYMGRSFRVGFGPSGTFTSLKSMTHLSIKQVDSVKESSKATEIMLQTTTLECLLENTDIFCSALAVDGTNEEIQLDPESSTLTAEQKKLLLDACPKSVIMPNFSFGSFVQTSSIHGFSDYEIDTWKLCAALWDRLELDVKDLSGFNNDQLTAIEDGLRKARFSDWLQESLQAGVESDINKAPSDTSRILFALSGNKLAEAIKLCHSTRNYHLATILSQLPTPLSLITPMGKLLPNGCPGRNSLSKSVQADLVAQIKEWSPATFSDPVLYSIWSLVSGGVHLWNEKLLSPSLSWKRIFAYFFWYAQGGSLSLSETLDLYRANIASLGAPLSAHSKEGGEWDLQILLFVLFQKGESGLEKALETLTHSPRRLDTRLSWVLSVLLRRAEVAQFNDNQAFEVEGQDGNSIVIQSTTSDVLLMQYVSQLERHGLWKWGVFVATFLFGYGERVRVIKTLLQRWYPLADASGSQFAPATLDFSADYVFLTQKLRVPATWIAEARALKARYAGDVHLEIECLLDAEKYEDAQNLVLSKYAPTIILSGTSATQLSTLLSSFPPSFTSSESGWQGKAGILTAYLQLAEQCEKEVWTGSERESVSALVPSLLSLVSGEGVCVKWGGGDQVYMMIQTITRLFLEAWRKSGAKIDVGVLALLNCDAYVRATCVREAALQILV